MQVLLQIDFPYQGPWGQDMVLAMQDLALGINNELGFIWKIWTENKVTNEAGGIYLFKDRVSAENYLIMHKQRLASLGIDTVNAKIFEINASLSQVNKAPL